MKKVILILGVIFLISNGSKAQQQNQEVASTGYNLYKSNAIIKDNLSFNFSDNASYNGPAKDYDYYMRKKKNNLTAGVVTLGAGLLLSGIGWATASNSNSFDNDATAAILLIAGVASGIASIPLMIMATVYGHKAKLELSNQKTGFGVPSNVGKSITGVTLTIPITSKY
jgi:uncharacterized membrane protein YphA (DoxX/SURF4 family)